MIDQKYWVSVSWGVREESEDEAAVTIQKIAKALGEIEPIFRNWEFVNSEGWIVPMDIHNHKELTEVLLQGRSYTYMKVKVIEGSGFDILLTNEITRMQVEIGGHIEHVPNKLILAPIHSLKHPHLCTPEAMTRIMRTLVDQLKPDHGAVYSREYFEVLLDEEGNSHKPKAGHPDGGWMTYISDGYWPLDNLPPGIATEVIPDHGTLITAVPEQFDANNPEHFAIAKDVMVKMDFD